MYTSVDIRFLYYLPSSIAAAAVLCAAQEMCSPQLIEFKKILFSMFPQHLHVSLYYKMHYFLFNQVKFSMLI